MIELTAFSISGLGKATARALAKRGAHVVLACRNIEKGEALKTEFEREAIRSGMATPSTEVAHLDVSDLKSVETFASKWRLEKRPLHILINNAGIFDIGGDLHGTFPCDQSIATGAREVNHAGMEKHMLTNHLGPFLLTLGLLPRLQEEAKKGEDCRIVNVSSVMHQVAELDMNDPFLASPGEYSSDRAYAQSKLAQILFGAELQRRLPVGDGVTVFSANPGEAVTDVARGVPFALNWIYKHLMYFVLLSAEEGSRCSVYCATAANAVLESRRHLGYFGSNAVPEGPSQEACSVELAKQVWEWSSRVTQLPPEWDLPGCA